MTQLPEPNKRLNLNDDDECAEPTFEGDFVHRNVARCRHAIKHADWRHILISNGFLLSLLLLITGSLVMVKKTSARLKNYPFTMGQAQPIITSTCFGIIYLCTLIFYAIRNKFFPNANPDANGSSGDEKTRLMDYTEGSETPVEEEVHDWRWWGKLYFHLAVVGTFLSIGNILLFSGSRGDYVPVSILDYLHVRTNN